MLSIIRILALRSMIYRDWDAPTQLYFTARKAENNGEYLQALADYETALKAVNKSMPGNKLRTKIIDKIKVLHTVIQYQNDVFTLRKDV